MNKFIVDNLDRITKVVIVLGSLYMLYMVYFIWKYIYQAPLDRMLAEGKLAEAASFQHSFFLVLDITAAFGILLALVSYAADRYIVKMREKEHQTRGQ